MATFDVKVPKDRLDLEFSFSSGQAFRWQKLENERWLGVDGGNWYLIKQVGDMFTVESNTDEASFMHFFRLDWDAEAIERKIVRKAPELQPYMGTLKGLRVLRPSDPVETFFTFLCTPNN